MIIQQAFFFVNKSGAKRQKKKKRKKEKGQGHLLIDWYGVNRTCTLSTHILLIEDYERWPINYHFGFDDSHLISIINMHIKMEE